VGPIAVLDAVEKKLFFDREWNSLCLDRLPRSVFAKLSYRYFHFRMMKKYRGGGCADCAVSKVQVLQHVTPCRCVNSPKFTQHQSQQT